MDSVEAKRKELGLTQREMAESIGVTLRCYQLYAAEGAPTVRIFAMNRFLDETQRAHSAS